MSASDDTQAGTEQADAARISASLETIWQVMRDSVWAEARRLPVPLTPPQILALQVLVDEARESGAGLSLSELSVRMGLAHSTVSGIVARLAARDLVLRTTDPDDRRVSRIGLIEPVKDWLKSDLPELRHWPIAQAIGRATPQQRARVLDGLATLEQLLRGAAQRRGRAG
jgi:DNA-binding MarR family transcriptional regulator